jgi:hypothetical protein
MLQAHQICPELYHFIAIRHQGNLVPGTKQQASSNKRQAIQSNRPQACDKLSRVNLEN